MNLSSLLHRLQRFGGQARFAPPRAAAPLCVIGDVHGCLPQLERLLEQVPAGHQILLVGDYIDRGEDSAGVLRLLQARPDLICLRGNHEDMLLRFLRDPVASDGARWLRHGGLQTLASFGVAGARERMTPAALTTCRDQLQIALGPDLLEWLSGLRSYVQSGNLLITHAGADPAVAADQQTPGVLAWGHPDFARRSRSDGIWVVHGHTIVDQPVVAQGRISIDTGAFAGGALTAVCLSPSADPVLLQAPR